MWITRKFQEKLEQKINIFRMRKRQAQNEEGGLGECDTHRT